MLAELTAGHTLEQIAQAFPYVPIDQLCAAVEYAAEVLDQEVGA